MTSPVTVTSAGSAAQARPARIIPAAVPIRANGFIALSRGRSLGLVRLLVPYEIVARRCAREEAYVVESGPVDAAVRVDGRGRRPDGESGVRDDGGLASDLVADVTGHAAPGPAEEDGIRAEILGHGQHDLGRHLERAPHGPHRRRRMKPAVE